MSSAMKNVVDYIDAAVDSNKIRDVMYKRKTFL